MRRCGTWGGLKALGGAALMALLLSRPQAAALGAAEALANWYACVAPALFPFMALMPLLTSPEATDAYERALGGVMRRVFRLPGAAASAVVIGLVAGAPAGTVAARRVASRCGMNRGQLRRLVASISGFSPAFLIVGIGAGMLGSVGMGWRLLAAQALTQLTLLLLTRRTWADSTEPVEEGENAPADRPIREAVLAVLTIGGYMALFGALTMAARGYMGQAAANALLCVMDVPSGARLIARLPMSADARLVILAGLCGFGGACVAAQNMGALGTCGPRAHEYMGVRTLAAALCAGYMAAIQSLLDRQGEAAITAIRENPFSLAALLATALTVPVLWRIQEGRSSE